MIGHDLKNTGDWRSARTQKPLEIEDRPEPKKPQEIEDRPEPKNHRRLKIGQNLKTTGDWRSARNQYQNPQEI